MLPEHFTAARAAVSLLSLGMSLTRRLSQATMKELAANFPHMNITIRATKYQLTPEAEALVEEKLVAPLRLLGEKSDEALLDIEIEQAPPEGRSSEPCRLVARLTLNGEVFHAEAVKPTPETAADRVRSELEAEIRHSQGRARSLFRRGSAAIKKMLRYGR